MTDTPRTCILTGAPGEHEDDCTTHDHETQTYLVEWSIDLDAESPVDAARQARGIQQDPGSVATVFHIYGDDGSDDIIDIEDPDEPISL